MRQRLLARYYDPFASAGLREHEVADRMLELVGPEPRRILHLGCGRGWLTRTFARRYPACEVIGVDVDPDIIDGARAEDREGLARYVVGRAEAPPVSGPFDAIVSSLLFHHLDRPAKHEAFARAAQLLAPGGRMLIGDFGRPHDVVMRAAFWPVWVAHRSITADNLGGHYPE